MDYAQFKLRAEYDGISIGSFNSVEHNSLKKGVEVYLSHLGHIVFSKPTDGEDMRDWWIVEGFKKVSILGHSYNEESILHCI